MYNDTYISDNPLAVLKPTKEPRRYTLAEYLKREERSEELHEYCDGVITKLAMARGPHNEITMNIATALNIAFHVNNKNYRVLGAQLLIYMPALNYSYYPDVLVVVEKPKYWDNNQVLLINPILIVEVLSRGTKKFDRTLKFQDYKTLESFQDYLMIEQNKPYIENHFREEVNLWRERTFKDISDTIYLKSLDCTISLKDIYKNIEFKK